MGVGQADGVALGSAVGFFVLGKVGFAEGFEVGDRVGTKGHNMLQTLFSQSALGLQHSASFWQPYPVTVVLHFIPIDGL